MSEAQDKANSAISVAAAEWVVLIARPNLAPEQRAAFLEWLRQSPRHVQEYLLAEVTYFGLEEAARGDTVEVEQLLSGVSRNVIELTAPAIPKRSHAASNDARRSKVSLLALAASLVVTVAALFGPRLATYLTYDTYATRTGEQRRVVLADGSTIDLNTQSSVRVRFTETSRSVELSGGEAYFRVARNPQRPFVVTAGQKQVRALGTSFVVRRDQHAVTVTLLDGKVSVTPQQSRPGTKAAGVVTLEPGQRVILAEGLAPALDAPAIEKVTAWRQRRLIFEDQSVAEVAAEFNRYNTRRIVIDDPELAGQRINAVFDADQLQELLDFLVRNTDARVEEHDDRIVITARPAE